MQKNEKQLKRLLNKRKEEMKDLLKKLNSCKDAKIWAKDKTFEEVYKTCERGDWLCWLFAKTNPNDVRF